MERACDATQVLYAVRNHWILITHKREHFRMLHEAWVTWERMPASSSRPKAPAGPKSGSRGRCMTGLPYPNELHELRQDDTRVPRP